MPENSSNYRLIKKYENRKLYDTKTSSYITISDLIELVRNGEKIKIVDRKTNKDITSQVLAYAVLEDIKTRNVPQSARVFETIIKKKNFTDFILSDIPKKSNYSRKDCLDNINNIEYANNHKVNIDLDSIKNEIFNKLLEINSIDKSKEKEIKDIINFSLEKLNYDYHLTVLSYKRKINNLTSKINKLIKELEDIKKLKNNF